MGKAKADQNPRGTAREGVRHGRGLTLWLSTVPPPSRWFCVAWPTDPGSGHRALFLNLKQLAQAVLPRNTACLLYPHGPNSLLSPKKARQQRSGSKLTQSGPLPRVPRHRGTRPRWGWEARSTWPVGRAVAEPKTTQPCGICSLPEAAGETQTEASSPLPSGPLWLPRDFWSPRAWQEALRQTLYSVNAGWGDGD